MTARYEDCVFLNVPFDQRYENLLRALVFAVHDCGLVARCAREVDDSGQIRLDKIYDLIAGSKYGIHDLSRTGLDKIHRLPRFNMPLELGIFLGARMFGSQKDRDKRCLVLDRHQDRYQRFCSDIAGHDIRAHDNKPGEAVKAVRNWLSSQLTTEEIQVPSATIIANRYEAFRRQLPSICANLQLAHGELLFNEHSKLIVGWLEANPW